MNSLPVFFPQAYTVELMKQILKVFSDTHIPPATCRKSESATREHYTVCWTTQYSGFLIGLSITVYSLELRCTTADEASPRAQPERSQITGKAESSTVYKTLLHWHIWHKNTRNIFSNSKQSECGYCVLTPCTHTGIKIKDKQYCPKKTNKPTQCII